MNLLKFSFLLLSTLLWFSCINQQSKIITITGEIPANTIGKTLSHEHLLVDFIGADGISYERWNRDEVVQKGLPYLLEKKTRI